MLRVLDLFSGIGGFSLGLERTGGFKTVAFCEIDPFCRAVLAKHWPEVPCHEDVRMIDGAQYRGSIDVVTGGVPCQPASVAGKRKGSSDDRWLWPHFLSVVRAVQPVWVLAENPRGIISLKPHGLAWILGELHDAGYETQCLLIGADDVGAPHQRKRAWIVGKLVNATQPGKRGEQHRPVEAGREAEDKRQANNNGTDRSGSQRQGLADTELSEGLAGHRTDLQRGRTGKAKQARMGGDEGLADPDIGGRRIEVAGREAEGGIAAGRAGEGIDPRMLAACNGPHETARILNANRQPGEPEISHHHVTAFMSEFGFTTFFEAGVFAREMLRSIIERHAREGVADATSGGQRTDGSASRDAGHIDISSAGLADAERDGCGTRSGEPGDKGREGVWRRESARGVQLADANQPRRKERHASAIAGEPEGRHASEFSSARWPARPGEPQHEWEAPRLTQFGVGAATDGIPERLVRFGNKCALKAAGNSVVPQVVELIGRGILAAGGVG